MPARATKKLIQDANAKEQQKKIAVTAPKFGHQRMGIVGTAPLVQHRFSPKAMGIIRETQEAGSTAKKGKIREPKDFESLFHEARHLSTEGWDGFHAASLRNALISACRLVNFRMTLAKMSVFVHPDGFGVDGTPLVRLIAPAPEPYEAMVRNATGVVDIRVRPMWRKWGAYITIDYDEHQFTDVDVINLVHRVGLQVGLCEGRPDSKESAGIGFGTFRLLEGHEGSVEDVIFASNGKKVLKRAA